MKKFFIAAITLLLTQINLTPANAAFPDDLEGVVFTEEGLLPGLTALMNSMPATGNFSVDIGGTHPYAGQNVYLNNSKTNVWPTGGGNLSCCNANAWVFVKVGDTWYASTWEYVRKGQIVKSSEAITGPNHLRVPPLRNFRPRNGETYGFMMSGMVRAGLGRINVRERTNISFFKFGVGPVSNDEIRGGGSSNPTPPASDDSAAPLVPVLDLLMEESSE